MLRLTPGQKIHYTLRLSVAMCFIGHGAFGIITKPIWCNYFAVFGISQDLAYRLMPLVGSVDILLGIAMLVYPMRAIPAWLVIWGLVTASLRPLSGEPFAELIERAGNFGAPLALLLLAAIPGNGPLREGAPGKKNRRWFSRIEVPAQINAATLARVVLCLRIVAFLLLLGHGWLNLIEKKGLLNQYASIGVSNPAAAAQAVGIFEVIAAFAVLIRPFAPLLIIFFLWKMASELFYPHYELFEWIERGGSYGSLLALWFALQRPRETEASPGPLNLAT